MSSSFEQFKATTIVNKEYKCVEVEQKASRRRFGGNC